MSSVATVEVLEQDAGIVVSSTGEFLPAIDIEHSTPAQRRESIHAIAAAMEHITVFDDVQQLEAVLSAIVKRMKQLNEDEAEAQRARILAYIRMGELLGDAERGGNLNPDGVNQYTREVISQNDEMTKSQVTYNLRWQYRTMCRHRDKVVPLMHEMKKPSPNAVIRELKRLTAKLEVPEGGEAVISHSRWEDWLPHQPDCDLLLTDPPYATDVDEKMVRYMRDAICGSSADSKRLVIRNGTTYEMDTSRINADGGGKAVETA